MNEMQEAFQRLVDAASAKHGALSSRQAERIALRISRKAGRATVGSLLRSTPKMLAERRPEQIGFEERNYLRWGKAFDLLDSIWVACEETGRKFNEYNRPQAVREVDHVFEALAYLNAKVLLVSAEMICLMRGGFADGALARWRTIYELNVIALLLRQEGETLAIRYLAHSRVQAWERIKDEFDPAVATTDDWNRKADAEAAMSRFGEKMRLHYGWAREITKKDKPTFASIEALIDHEHAKPLYQAASQHIHSNHRFSSDLLGMSEATGERLLVGPSNSGMVTPLVLCAYSMVQSLSTFILHYPNIDRSAIVLALTRLAGKMDKLAKRLERRTLRAARQMRSASNPV